MCYFNKYSWTLVSIYIIAMATMEYFSYQFSWESIFFSLPLIAAFICWSESMVTVLKKPQGFITKSEGFHRDLFLISFSFISGELLSLLFQYNNSDVLGWWPIAIYFISAFGILFAVVFSLIALILDNHKSYTLIYSITIIVILLFTSFMTHLDPFSFFASTKTFNAIFLFLIAIHLLLSLFYKVVIFKHFKWG